MVGAGATWGFFFGYHMLSIGATKVSPHQSCVGASLKMASVEENGVGEIKMASQHRALTLDGRYRPA